MGFSQATIGARRGLVAPLFGNQGLALSPQADRKMTFRGIAALSFAPKKRRVFRHDTFSVALVPAVLPLSGGATP
jgi:hypothetical protein